MLDTFSLVDFKYISNVIFGSPIKNPVSFDANTLNSYISLFITLSVTFNLISIELLFWLIENSYFVVSSK